MTAQLLCLYTDSKYNYDISQSDMYQMFAYGKKYEKVKRLFLLIRSQVSPCLRHWIQPAKHSGLIHQSRAK
ncbi:MAG TPA: hypothetical protein ENH01_06600 [Nitrospirae bacterium]|nr:hypothetical protein [Nitrospirota bacterium]